MSAAKLTTTIPPAVNKVTKIQSYSCGMTGHACNKCKYQYATCNFLQEEGAHCCRMYEEKKY